MDASFKMEDIEMNDDRGQSLTAGPAAAVPLETERAKKFS